MKKFILAAMSFLFMTGGACFAQSGQPSLADLARSRPSPKKASRVITNDDIATSSPQSGSEQGTSQTAPAAPDSATATSSDTKPAEKKVGAQSNSSISKDSPAVAELKKKLDNYKEEQEGWKRAAKRYEDLLAAETDSFRRQMYQDALEGDKHNVAVFQEKIDQTQAELAKAQK